jgi:hypothetical protein
MARKRRKKGKAPLRKARRKRKTAQELKEIEGLVRKLGRRRKRVSGHAPKKGIRRKPPAGRKGANKKPAAGEAKQGVKEEFLETNVDRLYKVIKSRGSISFEEASGMLGVPEEKIEEWALILEAHNLIRIHYPKLGKPVLKAIEAKKQGKEGGSFMKEQNAAPVRIGFRKRLAYTFMVFASVVAIVILVPAGRNAVPSFAGPSQGGQFYLIPAALLIAVLLLVLRRRKK